MDQGVKTKCTASHLALLLPSMLYGLKFEALARSAPVKELPPGAAVSHSQGHLMATPSQLSTMTILSSGAVNIPTVKT